MIETHTFCAKMEYSGCWQIVAVGRALAATVPPRRAGNRGISFHAPKVIERGGIVANDSGAYFMFLRFNR